MTLVFALLLTLGCNDEIPDAPGDAEEPARAEKPEPVPDATEASAQDLYAQCRKRVEGAESAGECATDADCAAAGCSNEVCIPAVTAAKGLTTPCDAEPCFAVLDACGCVDGTCTWSVKDRVPAGARATPSKGPRRLE